MIKFSVIIPFYNTPVDFFSRMINSVLSQTYKNFEIIIVNDGSDDKCRDSINAFLESRIRVIDQSNHGVSYARNKGILCATGDYIVFVDADDVIDANFFAQALELIKKYHPDVIFSRIRYSKIKNDQEYLLTTDNCLPKEYTNVLESEKQNKEKLLFYTKEKIIELKKDLLNISPRIDDFILLGSPCGNVYSRKTLQTIKFPETVRICEDQIFNRLVLQKCESAIVTPQVWYHYLQNDFSAMHKISRRIDYDSKRPYWTELYKLHFDEPDELKPYLNSTYMDLFCNFIYYTINCDNNLFEKYKYIKEASKEPLFVEANSNICYTQNKTLMYKIKLVNRKNYILLLLLYEIKKIYLTISRRGN